MIVIFDALIAFFLGMICAIVEWKISSEKEKRSKAKLLMPFIGNRIISKYNLEKHLIHYTDGTYWDAECAKLDKAKRKALLRYEREAQATLGCYYYWSKGEK